MAKPIDLHTTPLHLGLGASTHVEPPFTGMQWYADYSERHAADGAEGRLVALHRFTESWSSWEMHPNGTEVVICLSGQITLIQQTEAGEQRITLAPEQAAINPPGVWHTADVHQPTTALFITAGEGTENKARS